MPSADFEPTIPASERPQTHALDRAALRSAIFVNTGGKLRYRIFKKNVVCTARHKGCELQKKNWALADAAFCTFRIS
jgi:hypothetical protein